MDPVTSIQLTKRVNFGWIAESYQLFSLDSGVWVFAGIVSCVLWLGVDVATSTVFHGTSIIDAFRIGFTHRVTTGRTPSPLSEAGEICIFEALDAVLFAVYNTMSNKAVRGSRLRYADLLSGIHYAPKFYIYLLALAVPQLIFNLFVLGNATGGWTVAEKDGYSIVIVVGWIILGPVTYLASPLIADGRGIADSLGTALQTVRQDWLRSSSLFMTVTCIFIASACACCIGMFMTIPMIIIIPSLAYRDTIGMPKSTSGQAYVYDGTSWPPPPTL